MQPSVKDILDWFKQEPVIFIKEILGVDLWSKQREIIESVRDNGRTSARSASAVGKTRIAACAVLWFMATHHPATVLTTGKSYRQTKEQLWREIRVLHAQAKIPIGGKIVMSPNPLFEMGDNWFALGFNTDEWERFTGFHSDNIFVLVDEGSGVPDEVYSALENPLASGRIRKQLLLGNPTQSVGKFRDSFASPNFKGFHISAFDTPAFTGEEGDYSFLINPEYVEERRIEWGEDSPLYEVFIKGDFPTGETDRLIPFGLAELAINAKIKPDENISIGVDTARFGGDENALYVRAGGKVIDSHFWGKSDTEANIGRTSHEIKKYNNPIVNVDEGYNPGVVDGLKALGHKVNGISFQGKPRDTKLFANIRAEMFWGLAERFKSEEIQIPDDKLLLKQLTDIKKKPLNRNDQIIIESKDEMKSRGLKSPDRADALALCFYSPAPREPKIWWI